MTLLFMTHNLWLISYNHFFVQLLSIEIVAELPTSGEECRLWVFYLHGEELSEETCLKIVRDHDARQSFQLMLIPDNGIIN